MTTKNFFAVDLGATSGRTILATYDGGRVEMKEITHSRSGIAIISAVRVRKHQRGFPSDGLPFH